jgi:carboxymethylenebutenolidase
MILQEESFVDIATEAGAMRTYIFRPKLDGVYPGVIFYSEIFQMTAPIRRFAAFLAGHGYIVAVPEVYHELEVSGTVLAYDQAGSDRGNFNKYAKTLPSYDADAQALVAYLLGRADCSGKLGAVGICLGGHLAFRCALQPEILAAACFYATDLHAGTLGAGKSDDSLARAGEIKGELLHIWGRQDPHVPLDGRNRIKARLDETGVNFQWFEVNGAHAFMRDEGPRYDPALEYQCKGLVLELLHRRLAVG